MVVAVLGLFALLQATQFESVLEASLYAYTIYGAAITPSVLAVFFWKRTTAQAAVVSILMGTIVTIVWKQLQHHAPQALPVDASLDAIYPALLFSMASLIGISLLTPPPKAEQLSLVERFR
jgi:SSS family solute:Na+ symporter/sodium/proline symporter